MSSEQKKYWTDDPEKVEQYVLGRFSKAEMLRLDAEIADHEPGKELIRLEMEIAAGIRRHGRDRMKAELRKRLNRERNSQFYSFQYIGMAAAVLIIAIGIGLYQIWFSDLVAPRQFHQQQIVITSKQDTSKNAGDSERKEEASRAAETADRAADQQRAERKIPVRTDQRAVSDAIAGTEKEIEIAETVVSAPAPVVSTEQTAASVTDASSQLWLIGTVVMISERTGSSAERSTAAPSMKQNTSRSASSSESIALKKGKENAVVFRHRAMKELPASRARSGRSSREIETMLERDAEKLVLTLYDDAMDETDLQHAVVETLTDEMLVVSLPNQRITYQLPAGWNQSTRSR